MEFFREVTPLRSEDLFVILDSVNNGFDYPIHNHKEYELNLIMGTEGTRIVGDSIERFSDFDLVLLGPYLLHKWEDSQNARDSKKKYRVITLQFDTDLFSMNIFSKACFHKIRSLLDLSRRGVCFDEKTTMKAIPILIKMTEQNEFENVLNFFQLLNLLANTQNIHLLSSNINAVKTFASENNRIQKAFNYIMINYKRPDLAIEEVANELNLSVSAFSHFFKKHSFRSFTGFLIDLRLGNACKQLLSTDNTIAQICMQSGFNNISNFNRLFKKYKGVSPKQYRANYFEKASFDWSSQRTPWQFIPAESSDREIVLPDFNTTKLKHI